MTLEEALKQSREEKRAFIKAQIRLQKKKEKEEKILTIFIGITIIAMVILILKGYTK